MLAACAEALAEVNGESTILLISRCPCDAPPGR
jgi:hypothetical protein